MFLNTCIYQSAARFLPSSNQFQVEHAKHAHYRDIKNMILLFYKKTLNANKKAKEPLTNQKLITFGNLRKTVL